MNEWKNNNMRYADDTISLDRICNCWRKRIGNNPKHIKEIYGKRNMIAENNQK